MEELKRIEELIKEKGIKASDCAYHTNRSLENGGRIRVLVLKGDNLAKVEYICPKCKHYAYTEKEWKRNFSVKCKNCGFLIRVPRLRNLIKKGKI